jgi:multidrug efflux pump
MRKWLPEGVTLDIGMDKSITIRASLREVEASLLLSMALVILVVFLFLRNVRATSIPAVAAPVSLIGTFAVMYVAGYTLDNLSLMALTIATGFVVDDAIVVLENVVRRLEMGETPFRAAMHGAREVGFTIVSMTLSLVAVFIPILCMPGIMGSLFREFAVVLSVSVLISMAVSLTTTPMMCAGLLKGRGEIAALREHRIQEPGPGLTGRMLRIGATAGRMWGHWLDSLRDAYARSLKAVLRHKGFTLFVFFAVLAANVWMYVVIPKSFFPEQDTGMIMGGIRMDQSLSFQASSRKLRHIQAMLQADPAVEKVSSHISGGRGSSGIFIALKPLRERKISVQQVINRLRLEINKVLVGQEKLVDSMLIALVSGGHILLEGVPGLAKTTAVQTLAQAEGLWAHALSAGMRVSLAQEGRDAFVDMETATRDAGLRAWPTALKEPGRVTIECEGAK